MQKRLPWSLSSVGVVCWLVASMAGCDGQDANLERQPAENQAQAAKRNLRAAEPRTATARLAPRRAIVREARIARRAPEQGLMAPRVFQPEPSIERIAVLPVGNRIGTLDDALQAMTPREVIAKLDQIGGPLASAHYIFQRGSEVELVGERPWSVDGAMSVIDCAMDDPDNPASGRTLWLGGLELVGAPEEFSAAFERQRVISVLGNDLPSVSGRWRDGHISPSRLDARSGEASGRTLRGMGRTLDAGVDEEWSDGARTWERRIEIDAEVRSPVELRWEDELCPHEMTLNLVLRDVVKVWELAEHEGKIQLRQTETLQPEIVGTATLVALKVGDAPEIVEPAQRTLRARAMPRMMISNDPLPARLRETRRLEARLAPPRRLDARVQARTLSISPSLERVRRGRIEQR